MCNVFQLFALFSKEKNSKVMIELKGRKTMEKKQVQIPRDSGDRDDAGRDGLYMLQKKI